MIEYIGEGPSGVTVNDVEIMPGMTIAGPRSLIRTLAEREDWRLVGDGVAVKEPKKSRKKGDK